MIEEDSSDDDDDDYINLRAVQEPEEVRPVVLEPLQDRPERPDMEEVHTCVSANA